MLSNLRDFLTSMTDPSSGDMPQSYDSGTIFNQMIQEMLKMKFSQDVTRQITGQKGNGPT